MTDQIKNVFETSAGKDVPKAPLVSVVIPAYNCSRFIAESVGAALAQTFENAEVIVVNDGSEDTVELEKSLEPFAGRIIYIRRTNGGPGAARNTGIRVARGEYLAFVDGDDVWRPEFLEKQLAILQERDCDLIYCNARYIGFVRSNDETFQKRAPSEGDVTPQSLIEGRCNVILSGTVVKKKAVVDSGMFRETGLPMAIEDFELWFRMSKNGVRLDYHREILLDYRVHESNISGGMLKIVQRSLVCVNYLRENFDLTEAETEALEQREKVLRTQLLLEKAKVYLAHGDFKHSRQYIEEVADHSENPKLRFIAGINRVSPRFLRTMFKTFRKREFEEALKADSALTPA